VVEAVPRVIPDPHRDQDAPDGILRLEHGDPVAPLRQLEGKRQADDPAPHDADRLLFRMGHAGTGNLILPPFAKGDRGGFSPL